MRRIKTLFQITEVRTGAIIHQGEAYDLRELVCTAREGVCVMDLRNQILSRINYAPSYGLTDCDLSGSDLYRHTTFTKVAGLKDPANIRNTNLRNGVIL